jgi:hypothetical protein
MDTENRFKSPYTVIRVVKEAPPAGEREAKVSVLVQQRTRDDGSMSREFVSIKCEIGKRVNFFSVAEVMDLLPKIEEALPAAREEDAKIRETQNQSRDNDRGGYRENYNDGNKRDGYRDNRRRPDRDDEPRRRR